MRRKRYIDTTLDPFPRIYSRMLIMSNQLAGLGSVNIPMQITAGANVYSNTVLVF
jgi:hypothetical protein